MGLQSEAAQTEPKCMPPPSDHDLIVARATALGPAALAILRADGDGVERLLGAIFHGLEQPGNPVEQPRRVIYGAWRGRDGVEIDRGLSVFFEAGHSFTGNACAEFYCHGGTEPVRALLEACLAAGARSAEPGEFTRRAFLNGRMDLAQAEAVADLIHAQTGQAARLASRQLAGCLSATVGALRESLIQLAVEIEARIDFPEEELGREDHTRLLAGLDAAWSALNELLLTRRRGQLLREGARIALVGRPNAGKSSLLNALARTERAIVTPHPGTTRDTIECTLDLGGYPIVLIDTAGLRESVDAIEQLGMERTWREAESAELLVLVCDLSAEHEPAAADLPRPPDLLVWNKIDLVERSRPQVRGDGVVYLSTLTGEGLGDLEQELLAQLRAGETGAGELAINLRHAEHLGAARRALEAARIAFASGQSGELVMIDLRAALAALDDVLGVQLGDAILDRVFSTFCLGK